jgi:ribosomal-protein-alanine N-acetyltransferase
MPVSPAVRLVTERLVVLLPGPEAAPQVLAYFVDNRAHLEPWGPPVPEEFYSVGFHADRLLRAREDLADDRSLRLFLWDRGDEGGEVLGNINFTQFSRGPFQSCMLGYGAARRAQGTGMMHEALVASIAYVFDVLRLHRIQAAYVPANERSGRLLRRLGFTVEGYARDYLYIGGAWRDHIVTARTRPDAGPPGT